MRRTPAVCLRKYADTTSSSRCPGTASRQGDFSRLLTDDVSQSCEARSWGVVGHLYGRRIRIADYAERNFSLLSTADSFVFPLFPPFFFLLNAIKILQRILRGDLTPGRGALEFPRRLRKSLYRKQDHASVSARATASTLPLRPVMAEAEMPFLLYIVRCRFYQSNSAERSHRVKASSKIFSLFFFFILLNVQTFPGHSGQKIFCSWT